MNRRSLTNLAGALILAALLLAACSGRTPPAVTEPPLDAAWTSTMKSGRSAFEGGHLELAARLYQRALTRARSMDSAAAIADAAYNLAACRIGLKEYAAARLLLREARAETLRLDGNPADILLVEARVARLLGDADQALALTELLLQGPATLSGQPTATNLRLQAYLLRGQIACDRGNVTLAVAELGRAAELENEITGPAVTAGLCELAGRIHLLQGDFARAAERFDREAGLLQETGQYQGMAEALRRAAQAYVRSEIWHAAADRLYRAARTLFTQGDLGEARRLGEKALAAADAAGDGELLARTRALLTEMATVSSP